MGIKGKYFMIVSKATGLVLDVKGAGNSAGTPVIMWEKNEQDNQLWYEDPVTGTIRSKHNHLCLDLDEGNRLVVREHRPGHADQQWRYNKHRDTIENAADHDRVLDVANASTEPGADVCAWKHHGADNQKWKIKAAKKFHYFYIKSELNGKVLDIEGNNSQPGAKVIMFSQKPASEADNQLWFEDRYGNIRSKLNPQLVLDGRGDCLRTGVFEHGDSKCFWGVHGNKLVDVHHHDHVLDIARENADDCAELCSYSYHGGRNQHWVFEHASL